MNDPSTSEVPAFFVSADWSTRTGKRSIWVADVAARTLRPAATQPWTLAHLLSLAECCSGCGSVLVGVDAALGVSRGYWRLANGARRSRPPESFVDWLRDLNPDGPFFQTTTDPQHWSVDRPWFHVQRGLGRRKAFPGESTTSSSDDSTRQRRPSRCSPSAVCLACVIGSGTRALWQELIPLLRAGCDFAIWPFEGELSALLAKHRVVLAETYPRLAYGSALADTLPAGRMNLAKTKLPARELACDQLQRARWVVANSVDLGDLARVIGNEDDFDAHLTAAAVLRCAIDAVPLSSRAWTDAEAEGSMLLTGAVDPGKPRRGAGANKPVSSTFRRAGAPLTRSKAVAVKNYTCPIPGCHHVFRGSRGGWDAHVASLRKHPDRQPDVTHGGTRKWLFKKEHPEW